MKKINIELPINSVSNVLGNYTLFSIIEDSDILPLPEGYYKVIVNLSPCGNDNLNINDKPIIAFYSKIKNEFFIPTTWRHGGFLACGGWVKHIISAIENDNITQEEIENANKWLLNCLN